MDAEAWAGAHRELLAESFARRRDSGNWPSVKDLKRWAVQNALADDVVAAAKDVPQSPGVTQRWHAAEHLLVPLWVLRYLPDAEEVLSLCVALTKLAVDRYTAEGTELAPLRKDDPDVAALCGDADLIYFAGDLLSNEPYSPILGGSRDDTMWWFNVNDSWVDGYIGVSTPDAFFDQQRRFADAHRSAVIAPSDDARDEGLVALGGGKSEMDKDTRSVFVVHGRNVALRDSMFAFLRAINIAPMEWNDARALTGQASPYVGQILDAAFDNAQAIVVLLTPDEITYLRQELAEGDNDPEVVPSTQARPNVLFEAGMAMGRDSDRTVLVEIGEMRPFTDVVGRHSVRLTNDVSRRQDLAHRLQTAGCEVKLTGTDWHTVGDFAPPSPPGGGIPLGRRVPSAAVARPSVDFDIKHYAGTGNRLDKLQVINRGTEAAYDVTLSVPDDAALDLHRVEPIEKIPGGGKSVTVDAWSSLRTMGGPTRRASFDLTVTARTENGDQVSQDVFIDLNG